HRLALIDDYAGAGLQRHAKRQRDPQNLARFALGLDQHRSHHRLARFDTTVLAREANLLGVRLLPLQTELGPWRIDELRHLGLLLLRLRRGCRLWRRLRFSLWLGQGTADDRKRGQQSKGKCTGGRQSRRKPHSLEHWLILLLTAEHRAGRIER